MPRVAKILLSALLLSLLPAGVPLARGGSLEGRTLPIESPLGAPKPGSYLAVEGEVTQVLEDSVFVLRDDSGQMFVYIPDALLREHGAPEVGEHIRAAGRYDWERADPPQRGLRVQELERNVAAAQPAPSAPPPTGAAGPR